MGAGGAGSADFWASPPPLPSSSFPRVRGPRAISSKQCPCRSGSGGRSHTSPQSRLWLEPAAESAAAATSWPPHRDGACGGVAALPSTHATVRAAATPRYSGSNKRAEEVERVAAAAADAVSLPMHVCTQQALVKARYVEGSGKRSLPIRVATTHTHNYPKSLRRSTMWW